MSSKKKTQKKQKRTSISAENFVKVWQSCKTLAEAKQKLGRFASNRATAYRRRGVPLKKFVAAGRKLDVGALKALVK